MSRRVIDKTYTFEDDGSTYRGKLYHDGRNYRTGGPERYKFVISLVEPEPVVVPGWPAPKTVWDTGWLPFVGKEEQDKVINAAENQFRNERTEIGHQMGLFG